MDHKDLLSVPLHIYVQHFALSLSTLRSNKGDGQESVLRPRLCL